jgi:hypothetical protein
VREIYAFEKVLQSFHDKRSSAMAVDLGTQFFAFGGTWGKNATLPALGVSREAQFWGLSLPPD